MSAHGPNAFINEQIEFQAKLNVFNPEQKERLNNLKAQVQITPAKLDLINAAMAYDEMCELHQAFINQYQKDKNSVSTQQAFNAFINKYKEYMVVHSPKISGISTAELGDFKQLLSEKAYILTSMFKSLEKGLASSELLNQVQQTRKAIEIQQNTTKFNVTVNELLTTEQTYVDSLKHIIIHTPNINEQIAKDKSLSQAQKDDISSMIKLVQDISNITQQLQEKLIALSIAMQTKTDINQIKQIAQDIKDLGVKASELYGKYSILYQDFAKITFKPDKKVKDEQIQNLSSREIKNALITPIQRFPRLKMLFGEMAQTIQVDNDNNKHFNEELKETLSELGSSFDVSTARINLMITIDSLKKEKQKFEETVKKLSNNKSYEVYSKFVDQARAYQQAEKKPNEDLEAKIDILEKSWPKLKEAKAYADNIKSMTEKIENTMQLPEFKDFKMPELVRNKASGWPEALSLVAQMMRGYVYNTKGEEKPCSANEIHNIALYLPAHVPITKIFDQLIEGYKALQDKSQKITYLKNARILIDELIITDEKKAFFKASDTKLLSVAEGGIGVKEKLDEFLNIAKVETSKNVNKQFDKINTSINKDLKHINQLHEKRVKVKNSVEARTTLINMSQYVQNDLSTRPDKKDLKQVKSTAITLAHDIKETNLQLIRDLNLTDFYDKNWERKEYQEGSSLTKISKSFNNITAMVINDILFHKNSEHQKQVFEFYTYVLQESLKVGDYLSAYAVYGGLTSSVLGNLKYLTHEQPQLAEIINEVENTLMPPFTNRKEHQKNLESKGVVTVAHITDFTNQIVLTEDGNSDKDKRGLDNADKFEVGGKVLNSIMEIQTKTFAETPKPLNTNFMQRQSEPKLSQDEIKARTQKPSALQRKKDMLIAGDAKVGAFIIELEAQSSLSKNIENLTAEIKELEKLKTPELKKSNKLGYLKNIEAIAQKEKKLKELEKEQNKSQKYTKEVQKSDLNFVKIADIVKESQKETEKINQVSQAQNQTQTQSVSEMPPTTISNLPPKVMSQPTSIVSHTTPMMLHSFGNYKNQRPKSTDANTLSQENNVAPETKVKTPKV
ncbi:MAG: hypothetical protein JSS07_03565 [Proteobacteria bacterium]|nr:hypothetical protein [Pseudomonadota bacterium]